jgi:hypothetical protein
MLAGPGSTGGSTPPLLSSPSPPQANRGYEQQDIDLTCGAEHREFRQCGEGWIAPLTSFPPHQRLGLSHVEHYRPIRPRSSCSGVAPRALIG